MEALSESAMDLAGVYKRAGILLVSRGCLTGVCGNWGSVGMCNGGACSSAVWPALMEAGEAGVLQESATWGRRRERAAGEL